jgi:hypothetical protein
MAGLPPDVPEAEILNLSAMMRLRSIRCHLTIPGGLKNLRQLSGFAADKRGSVGLFNYLISDRA